MFINPMRYRKKNMQDLYGNTFAPTGATSTAPDLPEDKPSQLPEPSTYHILCMLPETNLAYDSGLIKAGKTVQYEELLSPILFVAKIGPDAFKDEKRFPSGPSCKVGDFIVVRPNSGTRMKIHGTEWRIINDDSVEATIIDPRGVGRV